MLLYRCICLKKGIICDIGIGVGVRECLASYRIISAGEACWQIGGSGGKSFANSQVAVNPVTHERLPGVGSREE